MNRCRKIEDLGRRRFLPGTGLMTAGMAVATVLPAEAKTAPSAALVKYPANRLGNIKDLKINEPFDVA